MNKRIYLIGFIITLAGAVPIWMMADLSPSALAAVQEAPSGRHEREEESAPGPNGEGYEADARNHGDIAKDEHHDDHAGHARRERRRFPADGRLRRRRRQVQRPLATVVVGGVITSTMLTLFVLPSLYLLAGSRTKEEIRSNTTSNQEVSYEKAV